jgi:ABC-type dipeptide/oligopeptide/nickel transport system ATPase component
MINSYKTPDTAATDLEVIKRGLSSEIVRHPSITDAYQLVEQTIADNKHIAENKHAVIIGESGCGKSSLMDLYRDDHCTDDVTFRLGSRLDIPAIFSSVPSPVTPKSMSVELLKAIGDKTGLTQTSLQLTERLIFHINHSNVKVVFLDECQHLLSLGVNNKRQVTSTRLRESLDWIKSLTNKTEATFVLTGMPDLLDIINADDQLARRFTNTYYLGPFECPDNDNSLLAAFADELLLHAIDIELSVFDSSYFKDVVYFQDEPDEALRLYAATKGNPSNIKNLVTNACCIAYSEKSREINMTHFTKAFEKLEKANQAAKRTAATKQKLKLKQKARQQEKFSNPFSITMNQLEYLVYDDMNGGIVDAA